MVNLGPFQKVVDSSSNLFAMVRSMYKGIQFGDKDIYIQNDGSDNLEIKNGETSKIIRIDGKNYVSIVQNGSEILRLFATGAYFQNKIIVNSGNEIQLKETGNSYYHTVGDDGSGNLRIQVTETGKNIHLSGGVNLPISVKTNTDYSLLFSDHTIVVTGLTANKTITFPASPNTGDTYIINAGTLGGFTLNIDCNGNNINDSGSDTDTMTNDNEAFTFQFDGTVWRKF